jgi:photosystem II stability/assembly factor-like uncharacterized protein
MWGEFADAVTTDSAGNIYAAGTTGSPDFPVTAGAVQTTFGGGSDAFIAKFAPDGKLLWCTYYGGSGGDNASGIGVDAAGNVIVAGITTSFDFPAINAVQPNLDNGHLYYAVDAFVVKIDPTGSRVIYATYIGGRGPDRAYTLAVDPAGNAYITGDTGPTEFFPGPNGPVSANSPTFAVKLSPTGQLVYTTFLDNILGRGSTLDSDSNLYITGAGQKPGTQSTQVTVVKLSADGSQVLYRAFFGGSIFDMGVGVAVDSSGNAYVTGQTDSGDFPMVNPTQSQFGARSLWRSTNSTATWNSIEDAPFGQVSAVLAARGVLYVASPDRGIFLTADGGATWTPAGNGLTDLRVSALVLEPATSALYAATYSGVFKSTDGAQTWNNASAGLPAAQVRLLTVDALHPGTLYAALNSGPVYKSTDGAASWNPVTALNSVCNNCSQALAVDPNTGNVYASAAPPLMLPCFFFCPVPPPPPTSTLYRSTDGGASWNRVDSVLQNASSFLIDSTTTPSTIYAGLFARSTDGGLTWTPIQSPAGAPAVIDPNTGAIYATVNYPNVGLYVSYDHGDTWQPAPGSPFPGPQGYVPPIGALVADASSPGTFWVNAIGSQSSAFVAKLSPDGSTVLFSTYLGGHQIIDPVQSVGGGITYTSTYVQSGSNFAQGIALDPAGNIVVAGATRSKDFPTVNPFQTSNAAYQDVFVTVFSADTASVLYSTYLGGGLNDVARAVAIDPQGAIIVSGQTYSEDFPIINAAQPIKREVDDAFVLKLTWR